jgi:hypothetical protein
LNLPSPAKAAAESRKPVFAGHGQFRGTCPKNARATHYLVRLVARRHLRFLDLRTEANLDSLGVDDQISTGQHPEVWDTCHRLARAVRRWWIDLDGLVYRPRTTPESSAHYAFFSLDIFAVESWPLADRDSILTELVLHQGFIISRDISQEI